jgi:hypothetical protein
MRKIYVILIFLLSLPILAFADLPSEKFMRNAFRQDVLIKWQNATGILQLKEEPGKKHKFLILNRPEEKAKPIKEFWVYGPGGIPPANSDRWSAYILEREKYISQLPLFVSGFGYDDEIPGYVISIPVLEVNNQWALICSNWSCDSTGWIKLSKPLILLNVNKDTKEPVHFVKYLFTEKAIPIFNKQTKEGLLNTSASFFQYPEYFPSYWNKFYIKLNFKINDMSNDKIYFEWWYKQQNEFFVNKDEGTTVIRWIEHDSGD